ncbi:MAG: hypothetical protein FWG16_04395 [Micrococcales bacterium]|nr:hypothetical protein [Micrococcales bacterium]
MTTVTRRLGGAAIALTLTLGVVLGLLSAVTFAKDKGATPSSGVGEIETSWQGSHFVLDFDGTPHQVITGLDTFTYDSVAVPGDAVFRTLKVSNVGTADGLLDLAVLDADEIKLGLEADHVYFGLGNVEFWLHIVDGNFPKVEQLLVPADGTTYLNFHPTDVQFVLDRIEKLPGAKDSESPLYFHINKAVQARAHDIAHKTGIALELSHSKFTGEPVDVAMNRHFLKNALQFGCWTMGIDPTGDKAVIFKGDDKTFVCMPLSGTEPEATHMDWYYYYHCRCLDDRRWMDVSQ